MPDVKNLSSWAGIVAPAYTPPAVVATINKAIVDAAKDPAVIDKLVPIGIGATSSTPAEFTAFARQELDRWSAIIRDSGLKLN
jgi:tripartite-type tricarboxylate transporter receptor subunit TctC